MPFGVTATVWDPYNSEDFRVQFSIESTIPGCHWDGQSDCKLFVTTESRTEKYGFQMEYCKEARTAQGNETPLEMSRFWCDDLNKREWIVNTDTEDGWYRDYDCGWPGFD
jgi:hypothetical protein